MDQYNNTSKEALIERIAELETFVDALKQEKDQKELLNFPWIGNLGHWHWNIKTNHVVCNDGKILALNYTCRDIPKQIGFEFFTSKLHPDDYENVMESMRQHLCGNTNAFEIQYRIRTKDGRLKWFYDRGRISKRDNQNQPLLVSGIVFDITESKEMELLLKRQNKQLEQLVDFDCLTEVLNRRGLFQKLKSEIDTANKTNQKLSIIMIDVDHFTLVNNSHGHIVGDQILKQIAKKLKMNMLGTDSAGRYGGEEFLIILPDTDKDSAYIVAERIRKSIQNHIFKQGIKVTISGGIKEYQNESLDTLIDEADKRLYQAKKNGRNQIVSH